MHGKSHGSGGGGGGGAAAGLTAVIVAFRVRVSAVSNFGLVML